MTAWVLRAGKQGEDEQWCLETGAAGAAWNGVGDMSGCKSRDDVRALLEIALPGRPPGVQANNAGQLWGLLNIAPGDIVILPRKTSGKPFAIGVCTAGYEYRPDAPIRHVVSVDWKRDDVPRTAIKDDLLSTLGALLTVFKASRNNAEARFQAVISTGTDPGSTGLGTTSTTVSDSTVGGEDASDVVDPVAVPTLETIRDRVRTYVSENFKGHRLTELVADILRVRGFSCEVSPPGPDQGVDILCGSGPLGLDSPTVTVEVKSETGQVSAPVVRGLQGAMLSHKSDQALLVAWGGITKDAKREIRTDRLTMRVWDADGLLDQLFEVYDRLPEETRRAIPLKQAWVLDEEAG